MPIPLKTAPLKPLNPKPSTLNPKSSTLTLNPYGSNWAPRPRSDQSLAMGDGLPASRSEFVLGSRVVEVRPEGLEGLEGLGFRV